jgi:hypothetical protein
LAKRELEDIQPLEQVTLGDMIDTAFSMTQLLSTVLKQDQFLELELEGVPSIKVLDIVKRPQVSE